MGCQRKIQGKGEGKVAEAEILSKILKELENNAKYISQEELEKFADRIWQAGNVFAAGAGRSGFVARAFANRLMHLGLKAWFVGESVTPPIHSGDLLVIVSGSGETAGLKVMAEKAGKQGAKVAVVTIFPRSAIGSMAQAVLQIPGQTPKSGLAARTQSAQPMGNAFEQMAWLICDSLVMLLMDKMGEDQEGMFKRHANLE